MNRRQKFTYEGPFPSDRKDKKFYVIVHSGNKTKKVHFGNSNYEDYTEHKDKDRRRKYISRAAGIRNGKGKLTKDDPFSPNYWAMRKLWAYKPAKKSRAKSRAKSRK